MVLTSKSFSHINQCEQQQQSSASFIGTFSPVSKTLLSTLDTGASTTTKQLDDFPFDRHRNGPEPVSFADCQYQTHFHQQNAADSYLQSSRVNLYYSSQSTNIDYMDPKENHGATHYTIAAEVLSGF